MTVFQLARGAEQREVRRRAILDTAAAMLAAMPVAEVTLNELSRRAGLAKRGTRWRRCWPARCPLGRCCVT